MASSKSFVNLESLDEVPIILLVSKLPNLYLTRGAIHLKTRIVKMLIGTCMGLFLGLPSMNAEENHVSEVLPTPVQYTGHVKSFLDIYRSHLRSQAPNSPRLLLSDHQLLIELGRVLDHKNAWPSYETRFPGIEAAFRQAMSPQPVLTVPTVLPSPQPVPPVRAVPPSPQPIPSESAVLPSPQPKPTSKPVPKANQEKIRKVPNAERIRYRDDSTRTSVSSKNTLSTKSSRTKKSKGKFGFFRGLIHGALLPFSLVGMLISKIASIFGLEILTKYKPYFDSNTTDSYWAGYILGVLLWAHKIIAYYYELYFLESRRSP